MTRLGATLLALLLALLAAPALAHLTPNSEIRLRFEPGAVRADVLIPAAEYAYATGRRAHDALAIARYLAAHSPTERARPSIRSPRR